MRCGRKRWLLCLSYALLSLLLSNCKRIVEMFRKKGGEGKSEEDRSGLEKNGINVRNIYRHKDQLALYVAKFVIAQVICYDKMHASLLKCMFISVGCSSLQHESFCF